MNGRSHNSVKRLALCIAARRSDMGRLILQIMTRKWACFSGREKGIQIKTAVLDYTVISINA